MLVLLQDVDERDELLKELESQVEYLRSEQERLKRSNEDELEQLNEVIEKLQQELANLDPKTAVEEEEEQKKELVADAPSREEYEEMKQKKDQATGELDALRTEHGVLLDTYRRLKDGAAALAETEHLAGAEEDLEEALREKTAGVVVLQAQVQALEQSAASRVLELEELLRRKNEEVEQLQLLLETTQRSAHDLQQTASDLEDALREKVAEALVSQATLEAFQLQREERSAETSAEELRRSADAFQLQLHPEETSAEELRRNTDAFQLQQLQREERSAETSAQERQRSTDDFQLPGFPPLDLSGARQAQPASSGKVAHLTQKLRDLEAGLSGMQKDQELQKELLSSSEEEVNQYERRLAVLMDLLSRMRTGTLRRTSEEVSRPTQTRLLSQQLLRSKDDVVPEERSEMLMNFRFLLPLQAGLSCDSLYGKHS